MKSGMMPLWIILIRQPHIIPYLDINHTTKGRVSASYPVYMKVYTLITNSVVSFFEDDKYIEMFAKVTSYLPSNLTKKLYDTQKLSAILFSKWTTQLS